MKNVYEARVDYLRKLAADYGVPFSMVAKFANISCDIEDYDWTKVENYVKRLAKWHADQTAFEAAHPHYCKTCEGWGTVGSGQMDRNTGMIDQDPCSDCADEGLCPWCGSETIVGEDEATIVCGQDNGPCAWVDGSDGIPGAPDMDYED